MIQPASSFRLEGFEPDNLLAFLALLGSLRALEEAERGLCEDARWWPRASWDIDQPPWRPRLHLARAVARNELLERVACGIEALRGAFTLGDRKMPNFEPAEYRCLARRAASADAGRSRLDVLAAVATDQALETDQALKKEKTTATPLCLMTGQGHQYFLERLATVPFETTAAGAGAKSPRTEGPGDLKRALFHPWLRNDPATLSFRWDPEEAARQALMAGDPTDRNFKLCTERGANRLAALGLSVLPVVAEDGRRALVPGARVEDDVVVLHWPIWREPASLAAIRALLAHPSLSEPAALARLGVAAVMRARIEAIARFRNVGRARPLVRDGRD